MGRIKKAHIPERSGIAAVIIVSIERVHAVVLGGDVHHVVNRIQCGDENIRNIKRLPRLGSIQAMGEQLSELVGIDVRRRQDHLIRILTRAGIVIMLG